MQPSARTAPPPHPRLHALIISAPFGNYIQPAGATPTLGTFTALPRRGRWWQTLRTVRYYPRLGAWVNRLGLRNPGIDWLVKRAAAGKIDLADKIVSIHGFSNDQWTTLLDSSTHLAPLAIELNMSCPNVGEIDWPADLFERAVATGVPVIVKLPPYGFDYLHLKRGHLFYFLAGPAPDGLAFGGAPLAGVSLAS